jgi:hypothetical protein
VSDKTEPPDPAFQTAELDPRFRNLDGQIPVVPTGKTLDKTLAELTELLDEASNTMAGAAFECHAIALLLMWHRGAFPVDPKYLMHVLAVLDDTERLAREVTKKVQAMVHRRIDKPESEGA